MAALSTGNLSTRKKQVFHLGENCQETAPFGYEMDNACFSERWIVAIKQTARPHLGTVLQLIIAFWYRLLF
jgi:hypothetical protein